METNIKLQDTLDNKGQQTTHSPNNPSPSSPEQNSNSIKLPGLEIGFPTTWSGSLFGLGIVIAIVIIFLSFSPEFRENFAAKYLGIKIEQGNDQTEASFQDSLAVVKVENENLLAKLGESEKTIAGLITNLNDIKTKLSSNGKKDDNLVIVNNLVRQASEALDKNKEVQIKTQTAEQTAKEIVKGLVKQKPYQVLVTYFFKKRSFWTDNYYWVSFPLVEKDILGEYPSLFSAENSMMDAISRLVDLKVLAKTQMKRGTIGYGVYQNSPTLQIFKDELALVK
jgi:hypothetical protein